MGLSVPGGRSDEVQTRRNPRRGRPSARAADLRELRRCLARARGRPRLCGQDERDAQVRRHEFDRTARMEQLDGARRSHRGICPKLKEQIDGEILVAGSRTLVHALLLAGLVDELRLMVFPVILGSGGRVFPESADKIVLELKDDRRYESGVQVLTYHPTVA
ncbi:dihydrofolate reductase family protein [Rhodococcus sp. 3Y1]